MKSMLTTKQKVYLMTGGGILALAFLIGGVLAPNIRETKRLHENLVRTKEEVSRLIIAGSTAKLLEKQVNAYQEELHKLNEGIIEFGSEVAFIEFLENLAAQDGVKLTLQVTQPASLPQNTYATSAVNFTLEGTFQQLLSYWVALEKSPYYINVTSFTVKKTAIIPPSEQGSVEGPLTANLSAVVFWHTNAL